MIWICPIRIFLDQLAGSWYDIRVRKVKSTADDTLIDAAAEIAADYAPRGADAVYVAVARRHGCTLVSLDREQRERAAPIVAARTPAEALRELQSSASDVETA